MAEKTKNYLEVYTNRHIDLVRATEGEANAMRSRLEEIHETIFAYIERKYGNETIVTPFIAMEIEKYIQAKLQHFYEVEWPDELKKQQELLLVSEVVWTQQTIENAKNDSEDVSPERKSAEQKQKDYEEKLKADGYDIDNVIYSIAKRV